MVYSTKHMVLQVSCDFSLVIFGFMGWIFHDLVQGFQCPNNNSRKKIKYRITQRICHTISSLYVCSCTQYRIVMMPTYWYTICIPQTLCYFVKKLGFSTFLGSAISISTYLYSSTSGLKPSASGASALLNTLLKSSAKSGSYCNTSSQSCGIRLNPSYTRMSAFILR